MKSIILLFLIYALIYAYETKDKKPPLSPEQIQYDREVIEELKKLNGLPDSSQSNMSYDSICKSLKFADISTDDSCLDRDCYVTKSAFNRFLNSIPINSLKNIDSIRTNILFNTITFIYIKMQANTIVQGNEKENSCRGDSNDVFSYKIKLFSSTDSLTLAHTLKNISKRTLLFAKPIEIIFNKIEGRNKNILEMSFNLMHKYLDFRIKKSILDSAIAGQWTPLIKSNFGYYSFCLIDKMKCCPEYGALSEIVNNNHSYSSSAYDTIGDLSKFVFSDADTLVVKLWARPAILSDSGSIIGVDTNTLKYEKITDKYLPARIREFIREQYFNKGIVFFENIKNDYCIWSLKIENYKKGDETCSKDMLQNYLLAKNFLLNFQAKTDIKNEAEDINQYLESLYRKNCKYSAAGNDTLNTLLQTISETNLQIQRSAFNWLKSNVFFKNNLFFEKYLPKYLIEELK